MNVICRLFPMKLRINGVAFNKMKRVERFELQSQLFEWMLFVNFFDTMFCCECGAWVEGHKCHLFIN